MKLISASLFIVTVGSYMIGLTIFLKPPDFDTDSLSPTVSNKSNTLCILNSNQTNSLDCNLINSRGNQVNSSNLQYMIYFGHFIIGFGSVALYTIGVAYIEDITTVKQSSYCQAIYYGLGAVGGGAGILLSGQFLNLNARFYMSSYKLQSIISPKSTLWIGAWYMPVSKRNFSYE